MSNKSQKPTRYTKAPVQSRVKKNGVRLASKALCKVGRNSLQPKLHVKLGDEVVVISGDDKDKIGKVIKIDRAKSKIVVEGVNVVKRHRRAMGPGQEGEILEIESSINSSKVMLWDEKSKKATRVAKKVLENGSKVRIAKVSGEQIDG